MGTMKLLNQIESIRSCPIVGRPMTDERSRSNPRGTPCAMRDFRGTSFVPLVPLLDTVVNIR
jgi:hypothetical protein